MSQRAKNQDVQQDFSEIVDRFIARYCRIGVGLNVSDRTLFPVFRAFWIAKVSEFPHPALLGQFRVELTERGFRSNGPKKPRWYGLELHQLTVLSEQEDTLHIESLVLSRCSVLDGAVSSLDRCV